MDNQDLQIAKKAAEDAISRGLSKVAPTPATKIAARFYPYIKRAVAGVLIGAILLGFFIFILVLSVPFAVLAIADEALASVGEKLAAGLKAVANFFSSLFGGGSSGDSGGSSGGGEEEQDITHLLTETDWKKFTQYFSNEVTEDGTLSSAPLKQQVSEWADVILKVARTSPSGELITDMSDEVLGEYDARLVVEELFEEKASTLSNAYGEVDYKLYVENDTQVIGLGSDRSLMELVDVEVGTGQVWQPLEKEDWGAETSIAEYSAGGTCARMRLMCYQTALGVMEGSSKYYTDYDPDGIEDANDSTKTVKSNYAKVIPIGTYEELERILTHDWSNRAHFGEDTELLKELDDEGNPVLDENGNEVLVLDDNGNPIYIDDIFKYEVKLYTPKIPAETGSGLYDLIMIEYEPQNLLTKIQSIKEDVSYVKVYRDIESGALYYDDSDALSVAEKTNKTYYTWLSEQEEYRASLSSSDLENEEKYEFLGYKYTICYTVKTHTLTAEEIAEEIIAVYYHINNEGDSKSKNGTLQLLFQGEECYNRYYTVLDALGIGIDTTELIRDTRLMDEVIGGAIVTSGLSQKILEATFEGNSSMVKTAEGSFTVTAHCPCLNCCSPDIEELLKWERTNYDSADWVFQDSEEKPSSVFYDEEGNLIDDVDRMYTSEQQERWKEYPDYATTASGTDAYEGIIAVDPDVVPVKPYTRTYVQITYGDGTKATYIAVDSGGAVEGNAIDVYFDNHEDAVEFGTRTGASVKYFELELPKSLIEASFDANADSDSVISVEDSFTITAYCPCLNCCCPDVETLLEWERENYSAEDWVFQDSDGTPSSVFYDKGGNLISSVNRVYTSEQQKRWKEYPSYGTTSSGIKAYEAVIAVDPSVIPAGSYVRITFDDGTKATYIAADSGSAIKGNRIDVYFDNHEDALEFGVKTGTIEYIN